MLNFFVFTDNSFAINPTDDVVETNLFGNLVDDGNGCGVYVVLNLIIDIFSVGVGIVGLLGICVVGVQYLTAGDNSEQVKKSKRRLLEIIIGLAVYALLYAVSQWLLPGGKINTGQKCNTITDSELAELKNKEKGEKDGSSKTSSSGDLSGKDSYKKSIASGPFKLNVKGGSKISYKTSNKKVAVVKSNGTVYPNRVGSATITASSNGETKKIKITITERKSKPSIAEASGGSGASSVHTRSYYSHNANYSNWNYVFRYKDPKKAEKAAANAIASANNNIIVYGQYPANKEFAAALRKKSVNWDPKKVHSRARTACSQFVLTMAQSVGINRSKANWPSADAPEATRRLKQNNSFYTFTSSKYTGKNGWKMLKKGDILIDADRSDGGAHAIMVVK